MNVKTMEGLAGAGTSISMVTVPMSAVKEAERKGDTDKMQRALGYAAELTSQAGAYSEKASQGMKLDAEETKKQERQRQEKLIQARKEGQEEQAKQAEPGRAEEREDSGSDSVQISEEGRHQAELDGKMPANEADGIQDVIYSSSGETTEAVQAAGKNVNISA